MLLLQASLTGYFIFNLFSIFPLKLSHLPFISYTLLFITTREEVLVLIKKNGNIRKENACFSENKLPDIFTTFIKQLLELW